MNEVALQFAVSLLLDLGRYVLVATPVFFIFWRVFGERLRARWLRPSPPEATQTRREVMASLRTALIFAAVGGAVHAGRMAGMMRVYSDVSTHGWAYFFASIGLLIVLQDAYFYFTHRAMHHRLLFRVMHQTHHLSRHTSPFSAYAFSPLEALVHAAFVPLFLLVLPAHEIALFSFLLFMVVRNVFGHLAIELFPAGFTRSWFGRHHTTTTHHALHHLRAGYHFGLYFTFWDALLGTVDPTYEARFAAVTEARGAEASRDESVGVV